ncbi:hypothetical protein ACXOV9_09310, partial [Streptococcus thermophilus]
DNKLIISMSGINPSMKFNLKISLLSYPGYASYPVGYIGDFLDITNHRVVSKKNNFINIIKLLKKTLYNSHLCLKLQFKAALNVR